VADQVQIKFGADIGGALSALNALKQAVAGATAPVAQLKTAFAAAGAAAQQNGAASLAAFKADMQSMVAEHAISLDQALGFDIEYTAQRSAEERARLDEVLASDAATLAEKSASYSELVQLSAHYQAQLAQDQARVAEAARKEADRFAQPYRQAFDAIGAGWRSAVTGLVEGTMTFQTAALRVVQSVESGFIGMAQTTLSRAAAGPLASLLGQAAPSGGQGVGDVLGNAAGGWIGNQLKGLLPNLGGLVGQSATEAPQLAATTALTTVMTPLSPAVVANTSALLGLTAAVAAGAAATTTSAATTAGSVLSSAGGIASAGANAGGFFSGVGSFFGGIGAFLGFAGGGIVPSAAGGWALPSFPGAAPALLHSREMVLPAPISEGLQSMIAQGGETGAGGGPNGGDMHLHFHGPSDGPAVERWFTGMMARNPGVVRNMLRSNALTPRTI
jgi:hypothetical protein